LENFEDRRYAVAQEKKISLIHPKYKEINVKNLSTLQMFVFFLAFFAGFVSC